MHYERCLAAIYSDSLNSTLGTPLLFTESTISTDLKDIIYREYGYKTLYSYMKCFHANVKYYGVLLKATGDIVQGSYWSDLMEDEELVYALL